MLAHYDGCEGQNHGPMGSNNQLDGVVNAVYIPPEDKREMPTIIPLDDETRRVLRLERNSLRHVWTKHWDPEFKFDEETDVRSISLYYSRHWFSTWFRTQAEMSEPKVQYLRGDKMGPDIDTSRSAFHRYVHTSYADVEDEYRAGIFKLGI